MQTSDNIKRIPLKGGHEFDVLTGWRKFYCYTSRAGVCKSAKKKYNRRFRKVGRAAMRKFAKL